MNRSKAVALAMEMSPAQGVFTALSKAMKIPSEPIYKWRCINCFKEREPLQPCCGEVQNDEMAECPVCEDNVAWRTGVTSCGLEYSQPYCTDCDWEGDPQ